MLAVDDGYEIYFSCQYPCMMSLIHRWNVKTIMLLNIHTIVALFCSRPLLRQGRPTVLEEPTRHLSRQGRGFIRPPMFPTPPRFLLCLRGSGQGVMFINCWHQMSNRVLWIQSLCCCTGYHVIREWVLHLLDGLNVCLGHTYASNQCLSLSLSLSLSPCPSSHKNAFNHIQDSTACNHSRANPEMQQPSISAFLDGQTNYHLITETF